MKAAEVITRLKGIAMPMMAEPRQIFVKSLAQVIEENTSLPMPTCIMLASITYNELKKEETKP